MLEGLRIAAIGLAWVFAALALIWGLVALLNYFFPGRSEVRAQPGAPGIQPQDVIPAESPGSEAITAERAQVAAIVAAGLRAGALSTHAEAPVGSAFEHGRTAPNWVTGNRARALQSWQPPRRPAG
jgi:hypothetical protein